MEHKLQPIDFDSYRLLCELVCESIRNAISQGVLKPGERIMEIKLAEELGISRTPIREAMRKLEQEGYVVMIPRRGTYVSTISIRDISDIFEIRSALETLSNGLAVERITDEELSELNKSLVTIGKLVNKGDIDKIVEADIKFHDLIYKASRNERLIGILSNLRDQLTRFRTLSMSYPGRLEAMVKEHKAIVDAIADGNQEKAIAAASTHMENSEKTLLEAMHSQESKKISKKPSATDK